MQRSKLELKKGSILRKELLEDIYNYPRIAADTYYARFSDGILYGLEWRCSKEAAGHHVIMPGALKYHGEIYFLPECMDVEKELSGQIQIDNKYRLCFVEKEAEQFVETQTIYRLELRAVQSEEYKRIRDRSFYYARVSCNQGNSLEPFYEGEVYGLYASEDGYPYRIPNWILLQKIKPVIESKKNKHPLDFLLLKDIMESKGLGVSFLKTYLEECGEHLTESEEQSPNILVDRLADAACRLQFEAAFGQKQTGKDEKDDKRGGRGVIVEESGSL